MLNSSEYLTDCDADLDDEEKRESRSLLLKRERATRATDVAAIPAVTTAVTV